MERILVIAPHPDDETLGAGGYLLKRRAAGDQTFWLTVTGMREDYGYAAADVRRRAEELRSVGEAFGFRRVFHLGLPPGRLDVVPRGDLVAAISRVVSTVSPSTVLLPSRGDVHSDHEVVFLAGRSATKGFRQPSIRRLLSMEILSETGWGEPGRFRPDLLVDVGEFLERKIEIMRLYEGELRDHPFPRSPDAIRAQALLRGSLAGCRAAEAFHVLRILEP